MRLIVLVLLLILLSGCAPILDTLGSEATQALLARVDGLAIPYAVSKAEAEVGEEISPEFEAALIRWVGEKRREVLDELLGLF